MATQRKWNIFKLDVKLAFLNGKLEEDVYIEEPSGYIVRGQENKVLKLKKVLYGLNKPLDFSTTGLINISNLKAL